MHASAYMQLCRTNLEQKSDLQWTPPKKTKHKTQAKRKNSIQYVAQAPSLQRATEQFTLHN